ncbi:MAG: DNA polymerase I [Chloroflexota bacterium]
MAKSRLVLFDGNAIVHRAFHAFQRTRPLTVPRTGEVVSAVYGFALMLLKVLSEVKPTHYAVAFDKKGPTFRHHLFEQYKAHRPATPEELVKQMDRVKQLVRTFHIPIFEVDKYEADDVLGTLSRQAGEQEIDTIIVTGDADTMQLVAPHVRVLYPRPGKSFSETVLYDEAAVSERYGVTPAQIADLKGLVGDPSDNIPGVNGIGDKTAVKLLQQFGSIEGIYEHLDEVEPARLREKLRDGEGIAFRSKELATIIRDVPVTLDLEESHVTHYDREEVVTLLRELEFRSLLDKLPDIGGETAGAGEPAGEVKKAPPEGDYRIVADAAELEKLVKRLEEVPSFAFDTETTGLQPMTAQLVGISLSPAAGEAWYIPVGHIGLDEIRQLPPEEVIPRLKPVLENEKIAKIAHNGKYDITVLARNGISVRPLTFDSQVAAYLLGESSQGLKNLAFTKLGVEMTDIHELIGTGAKQRSMAEVEIKRAGDYACADADMTFRLAEVLGGELRKEGLWGLFNEVEMPLVPVLLAMEQNGIALDRKILAKMSGELSGQISDLETRIYSMAGHEFNINSPQQLGRVLFDELQLPRTRRGKAGYSTEASVLEALSGQGFEIVAAVLAYRQLSKLKSTYIDALPGMMNPATGRVHTSFNQTRTATGHLSSSDPNMQNIPIRGELGKQVRRAFIAPEGTTLLAGDYSQIDLRALAHLSQDAGLLQAFREDADIHTATAMQLFGVGASGVSADMRRLAKTVNFGVIYGMSEYGLEQATELSREEAGRFIAAYFEKYPGVKNYLEATKEQARENGYVETLLGRRRYIHEINAANRMLREAAERMAINMPVQGTSADIIKVAMIKLHDEMQRRKLRSRMLLQVHDELIFEVPDGEMGEMRRLVPEVMCGAQQLSIPLKVDTKSGRNWGEME